MAEMKFDLENAQCELELVNNLLAVFQEYFVEECPSKEGDTLGALVFATRAPQYASLISAAQDKIMAMVEQIGMAIENFYSEAKKMKGGEAT